MKYMLKWVSFPKYIILTCAGYLRGMNVYTTTGSVVTAEMFSVQTSCIWDDTW